MKWFLFGIGSAFFSALYYTSIKVLVGKENRHLVLANNFLFSGIILLIVSHFQGFPDLEDSFLIYLLTHLIFGIIGSEIYSKALSITDVSLAVPMLSFTPLFSTLTSSIILREPTSIGGLFGIVLIILGSFILTSPSPKAPFQELKKNRGIQLMLFLSFIYSIAANIEKLLVNSSDQYFGYGVEYLLLSLYFFIRSKSFSINTRALISSLSLVLSAVLIGSSLKLAIVPYAIALKRTSALFATIFGFLLGEKHAPKKFLGALFMCSGAGLIALAK